MEWSLGVEPWSGVLEWMLEWILEWSEVRFGVIVALLGQDLVLIDQFLLNAFTVHFAFDFLCFFCHLPLTCFNQALNTCFIIGRQMKVFQPNSCIMYLISQLAHVPSFIDKTWLTYILILSPMPTCFVIISSGLKRA